MEERKKSLTRRLIKSGALYGGVFFLAFAATVYWTFPYALVTQKLVSEIERSFGLNLEMSEISPHWVLGLKASDVVVVMGGRQGNERRLELDSVMVRIRPLQTILSGPSMALDLQGELGNLRGTANRTRSQEIGLDLNVDGISLGSIPGLADSLGVGLLGDISGNIAVSFPEDSMEKLSGVLDLRIDSSGIGGGMIRGATIPPIDLGRIEPRIVAEAGVLRIDPNLQVSSDDLDAEVMGTLQLRGNLPTSRAELTLRFRPTDRFWEANQMLAGLARAMLSSAQQGDGFYAYRLSGAIGRPNFRPAD